MNIKIIIIGVFLFVFLLWFFNKNETKHYGSSFSKQTITSLVPIIEQEYITMDTSSLGPQATDYHYGVPQGISLIVPKNMLPVISYVIDIDIGKHEGSTISVKPMVTVQWVSGLVWNYHVNLDPITHKEDGYAIKIYPDVPNGVTTLEGSFILKNDAIDFNITVYILSTDSREYRIYNATYRIVTIEFIPK